MPDTGPDSQHPGDTVVRHERASADAERVPTWVGILVLAGLLILAAFGGYALRGAVNTSMERRLAKLDVMESGLGQVAESPVDVRLQLERADALRASGRLNLALAEYDSVLKHNARDVGALYARGTVLFELGRPVEGETSLWRVLAIDRGHARAAEALGDFYASKDQFRSLIEAVRPAVVAHPTEAHLQYLMGLAYENLGESDWAAARYRLALDSAPDLPEALAGMERLGASR